MAITLDSKSDDPGSIPGVSSIFLNFYFLKNREMLNFVSF